ncbi:MAG: hypothetical protein EXR95_01115 [Gemmatimonadetes bacterium]|nr:hypothetical protein [Gemmatimonadota bacterium]
MIPPGAPHPGLCANCRHQRWTSNRRGSSFLLCGKSAEDARFPNYPPLPVRDCAGYAPWPRPDPTDPTG